VARARIERVQFFFLGHLLFNHEDLFAHGAQRIEVCGPVGGFDAEIVADHFRLRRGGARSVKCPASISARSIWRSRADFTASSGTGVGAQI